MQPLAQQKFTISFQVQPAKVINERLDSGLNRNKLF
jgi:hypothetical protein